MSSGIIMRNGIQYGNAVLNKADEILTDDNKTVQDELNNLKTSLNNKADKGVVAENTITFTPASDITVRQNKILRTGNILHVLLSLNKSDNSAFAQSRITVGTLANYYANISHYSGVAISKTISASNAVNSVRNRTSNLVVGTAGEIIIDNYLYNDIKELAIEFMVFVK